jgi:hypothetical protein
MPSPTTAYDLIVRAMKLGKIISSAEVPTAEEATDALATLNDVLENWDTEPMSVWGSANDVVTTVAAQATYTVGPGGNFNIDRPQTIDGAYITFQGVDFPLQVVGQLEFNAVSLKTQQNPIPEFLLYVNDFPLGLLTLWPVPSQALSLTLTTPRVLTQIPTLATAISYPPGAVKALRYSLALELATEFGAPLDPALVAIAADAKADYKRANKQPIKSQYDGALVGVHSVGNWRTGY